MKKAIVTTYGGVNSKVGELLVNRLVPNRYTQAVGPFVFLDHLYPTVQKPKTPSAPNGQFAHPHRGIATFSYVFSGALEHFDSNGQHGIVEAGGAQWMNAGNGIIHDEHFSPDFQARGGIMHGLQFWINLPAINKAERPDYMAVQASDIPEVMLPNEAGIMRIVIGACGDNKSPVKTFSEQFIYHIKLNPKSSFSYETKSHFEYAAFVPADEASINGQKVHNSELMVFDKDGGTITFVNNNITEITIILFGGETYTEDIYAEGPFVMNSKLEIAHAYRDFFNGDYGTIDYASGQLSVKSKISS